VARVKVIVNRAVVYGGKEYTPKSGEFDMDPETAEGLISAGILANVAGGKPPAPAPVKPPADPPASTGRDVSLLPVVTDAIEVELRVLGIETVEDLAAAKVEDLTEIHGVGKATAKKMIKEAKSVAKKG
jgi:predicted flap endonuclease-1-like 5' DNA nuclease